MNLLRLNILVSIFIIFVIFIRKYGGKRIASYFYSVLCIDKTGIVSKALLSSDWHHEWDSVQATLQSVSAVLFLF